MPSLYEVRRSDFGKIRLYYGIRALLFIACIAICVSALTPYDSLSNPTLGMLSGLLLLIGLFVALRYSRPIIGKAFGMTRLRVPIQLWHALGIAMALAYAAHSWDYLDKGIAFPVLGIAGTFFFGFPSLTAVKLALKPAEGGALIQMAQEFTKRKEA